MDKQEKELERQNKAHYLAKVMGMELQNYQVYKAYRDDVFWSIILGGLLGALFVYLLYR